MRTDEKDGIELRMFNVKGAVSLILIQIKEALQHRNQENGEGEEAENAEGIP